MALARVQQLEHGLHDARLRVGLALPDRHGRVGAGLPATPGGQEVRPLDSGEGGVELPRVHDPSQTGLAARRQRLAVSHHFITRLYNVVM